MDWLDVDIDDNETLDATEYELGFVSSEQDGYKLEASIRANIEENNDVVFDINDIVYYKVDAKTNKMVKISDVAVPSSIKDSLNKSIYNEADKTYHDLYI